MIVGAELTPWAVGICVLALAYCLGGFHGVMLGILQPVRHHRFARSVARLGMQFVEWEDKQNGGSDPADRPNADRVRRPSPSPKEPAGRDHDGGASVLLGAAPVLVDAGPRPSAVTGCGCVPQVHPSVAARPSGRLLCLDCGGLKQLVLGVD